MKLEARIKELERKKQWVKPEQRPYIIQYRPGVVDSKALIAEYRRKGGKGFVFVIPAFRKLNTDQSNMSFKLEDRVEKLEGSASFNR